MDSFQIKLNQLHRDKIDHDISSFMQALFVKGTEAYGLLKNAIELEFRKNGAPEILNMIIDRVKYNALNQNGNFRVVLDITYTFGCEDLLTQKKGETSEWSYTISKDKNNINLSSSPFAEARSTAEEF